MLDEQTDAVQLRCMSRDVVLVSSVAVQLR